ncbi:MAG: 1-acyl-sn-glycerol-3-phosphate acyltransferase [Tepidisphaera sp.]|nr:1-acyl-sn-glycerol-3-phosphate acyltransferase [Tepidisphaera sp.]
MSENTTRLREQQPEGHLGRILFYEAFRRTLRAILWLLFGLRAIGAERVPAKGPLLIAANHQSYLDPPSIGCPITQRHLSFIARAGLFSFGPFGWVIGMLNSVPLAEDKGDAAAIRETIRRLEAGHAVLIFPEGSRTENGEIDEFKRGVALLLKKAKCPVLPVAIRGAYEAWPRRRKLPVPWRAKVRVAYGEPISYEELMKDGAEGALARIRAEVVRLYETLK